MILALGAMILLTILITNVNKNSLHTEDVMYDSNFGITATSIASSIIESATKLKFDNVTDTIALDPNKAGDLNLLTTPGVLGPEAGEDPNDPSTFNDFDDFDEYTAADSSMPSAIFNIYCKVGYVDPATPDVVFNSRTYHKKITVKVWSESMKDTMYQSNIFSYWYF
jgi:hypothetical protein